LIHFEQYKEDNKYNAAEDENEDEDEEDETTPPLSSQDDRNFI